MPNLRLEKIHVDQFVQLYLDYEVRAKSQNPPEPDFILDLSGKKIGIEHTQLIKLPDANGIDFMAHSRIAERIMQKAEILYNQKHDLCLMVHVRFRCDYGLNCINPIQLYNQDINELAKFISCFISLQMPLIKLTPHNSYFRYETYDYGLGGQILPDKIDSISITNTKHFKTSCWAASQGAMITEFSNSIEFEKILEKKNKKPSKYKNKYDELWLLIVEDSMDLTSYFDFEYIGQRKITSTFDQVFVLRRANNILIQINICK